MFLLRRRVLLKRVCAGKKKRLAGAVVLASRSEVKRGEWERFRDTPLTIRPVGSVACKLALVAAGLADATWTLTPKNEWDIAGGVALVQAAGGIVRSLSNSSLTFNKRKPLLPGLLAGGPHLPDQLALLIYRHAQPRASGVLFTVGSDQKHA